MIFICNKWEKQIWKSVQWNLLTWTNFEIGKHFTHIDYFSRPYLYSNEGQIQTSLFDKRYSYNFNMVRFPYKSSTIPSKIFYVTIRAEIRRICRATSYVVQFFKTSKTFLHWMLRQEADPLGIKKVLVNIINRHVLQFYKYNINNRDLIQQHLI